jgi:hypothetical protein
VKRRMVEDGSSLSCPRDLETSSRRLMLSDTPSSASTVGRKHLFGVKIECATTLI